ncbi:MAG TPA: hypothetical protein VGK49_06290, partial [Ilumatobacteraceae bacterium]
MRRSIVIVTLLVGALGAHAAVADAAPAKPPAAPPLLKVGAASRSVLPTVDGSLDYLDQLSVDPDDPWTPGLFVEAWDQGDVAVGNGDSESHWVHDPMEVTAVAMEQVATRDITVLVASNLYMIFGTDGDAIRADVAARLPARVASRVTLAISADHVHHGPDTAFDVNHEWYDLLIDRTAEAVVEAIDEARPARLSVAEGEHYFGLGDGRDPQVMDPSLGVLQATATNGDTIATLVFWANHPEVTLGWEPTADISEACAVLGWTGNQCSAEDRYFSADYPGWAARLIEEEVGGEALFFNGAIGGLVTPLDAAVWEVTDDAPLGNGFTPPEGAQAAGGGTDFDNRNFRRAYVIGEQLAIAVLDLLDEAKPVSDPSISYEVEEFYTRMSNIGFRLLLVRGPDGLTQLGHTPPMLYNCPAAGPKNDTTCEPDEFATVADPFGIIGQIRRGDHAKTRVAYLRIGSVGIMWLPAEVLPESTIGMPAGYLADPDTWHREDIDLHASGEDYVTSGYVKNRMDDEYRWVVGLGNDELGYAVPLSDYRIACVADALAGPGTCEQLHALGAIDFADAVSGAQCKMITEDPSALAALGPAALPVQASCIYGQALGEADDHYEETNSAGWDLEADI